MSVMMIHEFTHSHCSRGFYAPGVLWFCLAGNSITAAPVPFALPAPVEYYI